MALKERIYKDYILPGDSIRDSVRLNPFLKKFMFKEVNRDTTPSEVFDNKKINKYMKGKLVLSADDYIGTADINQLLNEAKLRGDI